jgi:hypothetical protein
MHGLRETGVLSKSESPKRRLWSGRKRYAIAAAVFVAVLLVVASISLIPTQTPNPTQATLDRAIAYFGTYYDVKTGLVPEAPNGTSFWLFSDNYLAALAVSRYTPQRQDTANLTIALSDAIKGYESILPGGAAPNQYTALNSTATSFRCSETFVLGWSYGANGSAIGRGATSVNTTANVGKPTCADPLQNYADLLFLQAVYYHRVGNLSAADSYYRLGAADLIGRGIEDKAYTSRSSDSYHQFQTYKLALYVYASVCLNQGMGSTNLINAESTMMKQQENGTGGFAVRYVTDQIAPQGRVNTETTALASLAIELMIHPMGPC